MNVTELKEMLLADMQIDPNNLMKESMRTPALNAKWMNFLFDEGRILKRLESKRKKMYRDLWHYYDGRGTASEYKKNPNPYKLSKGEIPTYVEGDPDYRDHADKVDQQTELVKFLELAVKKLDARGYAIKEYVAYERFLHGD